MCWFRDVQSDELWSVKRCRICRYVPVFSCSINYRIFHKVITSPQPCLPCVYLVRSCLEVNPHDTAQGLADQSMKKPIVVDLILFSLFLKQFRLGASTVSWSKLFPLSMTRFEKKIFPNIHVKFTLQIFLLWPREPLSLQSFIKHE